MPKKGYLTPSSFADLMSNGRGSGEMGKTALKVVDRLVLDMLNVEEEETGTPTSCQWGLDNEWLAIQTYSERTLCEVKAPVEFRAAPDLPYVGGTMDGLVGDHGGIEIKCPFSPENHLANLLEAEQLNQYKYQIQAYIWIYELDWIDFISFDPRFPEPYDFTRCRVYPDEEIITAIKERCVQAYQMAVDKFIKIREVKQC